MNRLRFNSSIVAVTAALLCAPGCDSADEAGSREVLRTHRGAQSDATEVLTVEQSDGALRTVLKDAQGEERAEVLRDGSGDVDASVDGQPWAAESVVAVDLGELHNVLHDVGGGLNLAEAGSAGVGKADGASSGVTAGYYAPIKGRLLVDGCAEERIPREVEEGEAYLTVVTEIHDVTASSYTATEWVALEDGTLRHTTDHPEGNYSRFMECRRVGPVVAFCEGHDIWDINPGVLTFINEYSEIQVWNRSGGGYRVVLAENSTDCEGSICPAIIASQYPNGLPCENLSNYERRPTGLPVVFESGDSI